MRIGQLVVALFAAAIAAGCDSDRQSPAGPTPTAATGVSTASPSAAAAPPGPCAIGFDALAQNGAAFTTFAECGLTITAGRAQWQVSTGYGNPAPFVQFVAPAGNTANGEITVQSADGAFRFASVDIYSSTTKIPYEIIGTLRGAEVFSMGAEQGNTFGRFATIANARLGDPVDTLRIRLTNPAAPCCANPVGLDTLRVIR